MLEGILSENEVKKYREIVLSLRERFPPEVIVSGTHGPQQGAVGRYTFENVVEHHPDFVALMTNGAVLEAVEELMGGHVTLQQSQGMIRPRNESYAAFWHRDGPPLQASFAALSEPPPLMTVKCGYFLTDLPRERMGNLVVVPGSHRTTKTPPLSGLKQVEDLRSSISLCCRAGDVVLFHNALWHAVARNTSTVERITLYFAYCYPWMRGWDHSGPTETLKQTIRPVERWMLGDFIKPSEAYSGKRRI